MNRIYRIGRSLNLQPAPGHLDFGAGISFVKDLKTGRCFLRARDLAIEIPPSVMPNGKLDRSALIGLIDELEAAILADAQRRIEMN